MRYLGSLRLAILSLSLLALSAAPAPAQELVLPKPEAPFQGKIGRTVKFLTPDFPMGVKAPAGAPNVLLIMTDDVGFGASSTFGGPIETPNFQRTRRRWAPLQHVPHNRALLADARRADLGPQSPLRGERE